MGSLTSMLMHTLFNVNVTINNLIVKLAAGGTMTTLACKSIMACTPDDGWKEELEVLPALRCCLNVENHPLQIRAPACGEPLQQLMHPASACCQGGCRHRAWHIRHCFGSSNGRTHDVMMQLSACNTLCGRLQGTLSGCEQHLAYLTIVSLRSLWTLCRPLRSG